MAHENVIREIVADLDRITKRVRTLAERDDIGREADNALDSLTVTRFWLREIGHGGHFDTPRPAENDTEPSS
jgi:hypothetical protein